MIEDWRGNWLRWRGLGETVGGKGTWVERDSEKTGKGRWVETGKGARLVDE